MNNIKRRQTSFLFFVVLKMETVTQSNGIRTTTNTQKDLAEQNNGIMTPPMSPIKNSMDSNRHSANVAAGQTGLPWLARDAEGDHFHPHQQQESPPPKLSAKPASIVRIPTRKRTIQRHAYRMKDGLDPVKVLCDRIKTWQVSVKYLVCIISMLQQHD